MNNQEKYAREILERYINGKTTIKENEWVERYYLELSEKKSDLDQNLADEHFKMVWSNLEHEIEVKKSNKMFKLAAIAASLIFVLLPIHLYYKYADYKVFNVSEKEKSILDFDETKTLLFINDENTLTLEDMKVGSRFVDNGVIISKNEEGVIIFESQNQRLKESTKSSHSISTPRSKQHKIQLPDKSIVWLNANSRIEFDVPMGNKHRAVSLIGEAYFEVEKDADRPFIVSSKGQQIIVKGTKFNICSYPNENASVTTLVEGSVDINLIDQNNAVLKQSNLIPNDQIIVKGSSMAKHRVNAIEFIDWKSDKFIFNDSPLKDVMNKISRWYGIEVVFEENIDEITFSGSVSKFEDIRDVLRKISHTESVQFEITERRIMVKK